MLLNCGDGEDSWESLGLQGDPTGPSWRKWVLNIHWKDWCWSWNSNTLATWCEEVTHWKRPWCWERLRVGGEGDDREWDGWMASPTRWTFVDKVMSLLFNVLSRLVIAFLPRSQWVSFNFMAAVTICSDFGAPKIKVCHYFHGFPIYLPLNGGTRCHDLSFLNVEF